MAGYFGIGIYHNKYKRNIGTLWRSAQLFEASHVFTIFMRYKWRTSDTLKTWRNVPFFNHESIGSFHHNLPHDCTLVGLELTSDAMDIIDFVHPKRANLFAGSRRQWIASRDSSAMRYNHQIPR
jgi:hypothetical protein